jgi:hypothetical protein
LEETVNLADQDGVDNFIFDDFPGKLSFTVLVAECPTPRGHAQEVI